MKEKMLEYLQGLIDEVKSNREDGFREMANDFMSTFNTCSAMYWYVTGRHVTVKNWKVVEEDMKP